MKSRFIIGLPLALVLSAGGLGAQAKRRFVPSVEITDTVARCDTMVGGGVRPGERGFILRFGPPTAPTRVVSAVWDTTGHIHRYSDARGDLRGPPVTREERGDRATITIDFVRNMAMLMNEAHAKSLDAMITTPDDILGAAHLGSPRRMLERLHRQCGAPNPP